MTDLSGVIPKHKLTCRNCGGALFFVAIAEGKAAALVCVVCLTARKLRAES